MNSFGERLTKLRNIKDKTQTQVADEMKISAKSIYRYENGTQLPKTDVLEMLAQYYRVSVDYLLGRSIHMFQRPQVSLQDDWLKNLYYSKCINNEIEKNSIYYYLNVQTFSVKKIKFETQTQWVGYTDDNPKREIREIRPVNPCYMYDLILNIYGTPLIVNDNSDMLVYFQIAGHAIVKEDICKENCTFAFEKIII